MRLFCSKSIERRASVLRASGGTGKTPRKSSIETGVVFMIILFRKYSSHRGAADIEIQRQGQRDEDVQSLLPSGSVSGAPLRLILRAQIRRPVDVDNAAGQKIRALRGQKQDGLRDFIRPRHALERALAADRLAVGAVDFPGDALRIYEAGRDYVNEDVMRGQGLSQRLAH